MSSDVLYHLVLVWPQSDHVERIGSPVSTRMLNRRSAVTKPSLSRCGHCVWRAVRMWYAESPESFALFSSCVWSRWEAICTPWSRSAAETVRLGLSLLTQVRVSSVCQPRTVFDVAARQHAGIWPSADQQTRLDALDGGVQVAL